MKKIYAIALSTAALAAVFVIPAHSQKSSPFAGRWDITVTRPNGTTFAGWMEFIDENNTRVQPSGGSVHPAYDVKVDGSHLTLTMTRATEKRAATTWDLTVSGDKITGQQKQGDETFTIAGVRAPKLDRKMPKSWSNPEPIFNGKDLTGWEPIGMAKNNWVAEDGVLLNKEHGANLRTTRTFNDFKLHIELNCPEGGNSGVYMRGRYEMQVEYEPVDANDKFHSIGAIYGMVAPSVMLPRTPGQWETFDVTLVGRHISIVRNGTKTVDNQEIAGPTGGALDANESEPGPFYLQGDHTGGMKYRNITVQVPK